MNDRAVMPLEATETTESFQTSPTSQFGMAESNVCETTLWQLFLGINAWTRLS